MSVHDQNVPQRPDGEGPEGLTPRSLAVLGAVYLGPAAASATNDVYTRASAWSAATLNSSVAPGTQPIVARNVQYLLSPNTGSSSLYSGGSIVLFGRALNNSTISESVALTRLNQSSAPIQGTACFAQIDTVHFSNVSIHTGSSSASTAFSVHIGGGNKLGLPQSVHSTHAIPWAYIGTSIQLTTSNSASTSNRFTVATGQVGTAGISFSNALATNTPVFVYQFLSR